MISTKDHQDIQGGNTCPLRRVWASWAAAAWRGHGFGMGLTASSSACRDITKKVKPDFSQGWTAGGWESRHELKVNRFRLDIRINFVPMKISRHWKRLTKGSVANPCLIDLCRCKFLRWYQTWCPTMGVVLHPTSPCLCFCNLDGVAGAFSDEEQGKKSVSTSAFSTFQVTTPPVSFWRRASLSFSTDLPIEV